MILKNGLLPNVFDLSSLSRALEEIVLPQAGRFAMATFNAFDLSSLAMALDEDIASQAAHFTTAISNAFDLSALSLALDGDNAAKTTRHIIPVPNVFDMSPLSRTLNEIPANTVSNVFRLTLLDQALDEDITRVQMNVEITVDAVNTVNRSAVPVNNLTASIMTTGPPTIPARGTRKLSVRDAHSKNTKAKVEDRNRRIGINKASKPLHRSLRVTYPLDRTIFSAANFTTIPAKQSAAPAAPIDSRKRRFDNAFEVSQVLPVKRQRKGAESVESLAHILNRKRELNDAFESFELPAKKRQRDDDLESPASPARPVVNCQSVLSVSVNPLSINKRKRDDATESSETEHPRKRRRTAALLSGDSAQCPPLAITHLPTTPVASRNHKREEDVEQFTPQATSTPVKQRIDDSISFEEFEAERIRCESIPQLKERSCVVGQMCSARLTLKTPSPNPSITRSPRKTNQRST